MRLHGGCLCGSVRYGYEGPLAPISLCHCRECQKAQGTAFVAVVALRSDGFQILSGQGRIEEFNSSGDKVRAFCRSCGSPLYSRRSSLPEFVRVRVGSLDDTTSLRAGYHQYFDERAGWYELADDLPRHPGQPRESSR